MINPIDNRKDLPGPGTIVLFGSGETSPSGRKIFDLVFKSLPVAPRVALLETPAGFELNSPQVIGRVAEFFNHRLQNYRPQVSIVPARQRGTPFSPDNPDILADLFEADLVFMGPGSPTYAVRQLRASLTWQMMLARHYLGAVLVLASAATIAASRYTLPVYEIYKAGEDLHWKDGLDLFGLYGLPLVFIPHWNNQDGGGELDTSCCFMGQERFARLKAMLPTDITVLGIDEKTALVMHLQTGICHVAGLGGVTLIHNGRVKSYLTGSDFLLSECCPFVHPSPGRGVSDPLWQQALASYRRKTASQEEAPAGEPPHRVQELLAERQAARSGKDWAAADVLRQRILELGWQVVDTPQGVKVERLG